MLCLLLRQKYSTVIVSNLTCEHCKKYIGINKKTLSVHYRTCITYSPNVETMIV